MKAKLSHGSIQFEGDIPFNNEQEERAMNGKEAKTSRYEQIKELSLDGMAEFLSFYFDCSSCPAKQENCAENDAMHIDAIRKWLQGKGKL